MGTAFVECRSKANVHSNRLNRDSTDFVGRFITMDKTRVLSINEIAVEAVGRNWRFSAKETEVITSAGKVMTSLF
ncbi:hypothetical protein TNCV_510771 [Trichonephila clavipes]|nr:hypothetical protein TNCV_510771 [Trichonephila clavipes]